MTEIISKVAVIFVYLAVGYAANRIGVLPDESKKHLISLLMNITTPCLIFSTVTGRELDSSVMTDTLLSLVIMFVLLLLLDLLCIWICRRLGLAYPNELALAMSAPNCGFIGIPITMAVFGQEVLYYVVIGNVSFNVFMYVVSGRLLHLGEDQAQRDRKTWRDTVRSLLAPVTVSSVLSVILLFMGIHLPGWTDGIVTEIGDMTVPLSMITVGVQLGSSRIGKIIRNKSVILASIVKLIPVPALSVLLLAPFDLAPIVKLAIVLQMVFPTAVVSVVIAEYEGKNSGIAAETIAVTTLLSLATLPVWIMILQEMFIPHFNF